jgi:hypothetical protein
MLSPFKSLISLWSPTRNEPEDDEDILSIYCQQSSNWDCGVACSVMVLRWINLLGVRDVKNVVEWRSEDAIFRHEIVYGRDVPLWTIDLYLLLHSISLPSSTLRMYTTCVGYNSSHRSLPWYNSVSTSATTSMHDQSDIDRKFELAKQQGLQIFEVSMPMAVVHDVQSMTLP